MPGNDIVVVGAREHNLKGVDLRLPRDRLVVFTGLSGSGKSSLAFDTIYQEGQRRFMESLSAYARQFLGKMEKPDVEHVEGLSPTISIDQKTVNRNPRSTVGTVTEILDHLRLLLARLGTPHCPECDRPIQAQSAIQIADDILSRPEGTRIVLLAPIVQDRKGEYRKELAKLREDGWVRVRIDGEMHRLEDDIALARYEKHTIEIVLDRVKIRPDARPRVIEAVERAIKLANGVVTALVADKHTTWSALRTCIHHPHISIPELEPRLFSFNAPQGACPDCNGLGELVGFDPTLIMDPDEPLPTAVRAFNDQGRLPFSSVDHKVVNTLMEHIGADTSVLWKDQPDAVQQAVLFAKDVTFKYTTVRESGGRTDKRTRTWDGIATFVERIYHFTKHKPFERYRVRHACPGCGGARLNAIARSVRFRDQGIGTLSTMSVVDARAFFDAVELQGAEDLIGRELVRELCDRLGFLEDVGLGYLGLSRSSVTLSGGEAQRIRLAAQVGSGLRGVTYVLDEPSIGLHPRDNQRLLKTLLRLRDQGNSVLVVEHDRETMEVADYIVDVGPGAGRLGGRVVTQGPPHELTTDESSTARYLRGEDTIPLPEERRGGNGQWMRIVEASENNLQDVTVAFPLGAMTCVTGVSGSGKSSLIVQTLQRALVPGKKRPGRHRRIEGEEHVDKVIVIDQAPIGRTPRSNPATYTGAFDEVRKLFAKLPESKARGYKVGRFSFNVSGGRCEECQGAGVKTIEMQFLADVQVPCEACGTQRFNAETLEVRYRGRTITDVLNMSIDDAARFFENHRKLKRILVTLVQVGLGYVHLGQPSTTLSGGEAQRVKLATELQRPATGTTLYILDEPTTGLHFADIVRLRDAMDALVEAGNTVLIIEHNTDIIKVADYIIDMGPEGGTGGGKLVGVGAPEHIATLDTPTGRVLAELPEFAGAPIQFRPQPKPTRVLEGDLVIHGARCHNLKNIDVRIPRASFTVVTGVSGSGKSSLAFDTVFAEGQRRYVECMSTYARRFLGRMERAPVEKIEGLAPAIAINQKSASRNPRSTVATVTEIQDYLRLLWSRIGEPHCWQCNRSIEGFSPSRAAGALQQLTGRGWLCARLGPHKKAAGRRKELLKEGFLRLHDGEDEVLLDDAESEAALTRGCLLVIDRIKPSTSDRARLSESVQTCYAYGNGQALYIPSQGEHTLFTEAPTCVEHGPVLPPELTPRHFSFNSWVGGCPMCDGLGRVTSIDPDLLLPKKHLKLWDALDPRVASVLKRSAKQKARIQAVLKALGLKLGDRVEDYTGEQLHTLLYGHPEELELTWSKRWGKTTNRVTERVVFEGIVATINGWNASLDWLRAAVQCPECRGGRLRKEHQAVTVAGLGLHKVTEKTVEQALDFFQAITLNERQTTIAEQPLHEVCGRLTFLMDVGLAYLNLDRAAATLSGGESQRIRLATQLGSGLTGCIYVLDEPTVGLHPRDTRRLLDTLMGLRDLGNTVLVVEHDQDTWRQADHILELGPGAGEHGGNLIAQGTPDELCAHMGNLTGAFLSGRRRIDRPTARRTSRTNIRIQGARANNLKGVDASIPTGCLTVVTGVSGSGKSSLIMDCLVPGFETRNRKDGMVAPVKKLKLPTRLKKLFVVDQSPIGSSPRSTPATQCKLMDPLRELFAKTTEAQVRGYTKTRFSYNHKESGRCSNCEGRGQILVEMHFLSDVWVVCEHCDGRRFDEATLEVKWKGLSIADVLNLTVDDAVEVFHAHRRLLGPLQSLKDVGLGYIRLGQSSATLSGGEGQRVKLARELRRRGEDTLFVLDEPTTGLHPADTERLVAVLHRLVDQGATVVLIEHNTDLMWNADYILDIGPEGGAGGGELLAAGTPEEIALLDSPTGRALAETQG